MRAIGRQSQFGFRPEPSRLETPSMAGYRNGMSSSGVIGRKLGTVYGVQAEVPEEMGAAIREIRTRLDETK